MPTFLLIAVAAIAILCLAATAAGLVLAWHIRRCRRQSTQAFTALFPPTPHGLGSLDTDHDDPIRHGLRPILRDNPLPESRKHQ